MSDSCARLQAIGWRAERYPDVDPARLARVVAVQRGALLLHDGERLLRTRPEGKRRGGEGPVVVGDWVRADPAADPPAIVERLPRFSLIERSDPETGRPRPMVANVDRALILSALDGDFNPRRLERYLGLALASGVAPLVVLTKADRVAPEERERCEAIARALLPGLEVRVADPRSPAAGALLAPCLGPGETVVLLGSSGVGKSTLVNTLAGAPLRRTGEVRQRDGKGRHTTTERTLIPLPGGACVIDTPGLRTIAFAASESELPLFAEIEALAVDCRFRDCRHESEPGCAVRAAAEEGRLDRERLARFRKLRAELAAARRARER